jgi:hypothetical protein
VSGSTVRVWAPVVLWAALIFALSSIPDLGTGLGGWDLFLRKLAHAAEYAVLGALLVRAITSPALALTVGTLYAVSDEIHQALVPGRQGAPLDVAIDAVGVAAGVVLWQRARAPLTGTDRAGGRFGGSRDPGSASADPGSAEEA